MNLTSRALLLGLLTISACDDSNPGTLPDGSLAGDAVADAGTGSVTLHVWDPGGAPAVGRAVVFLGQDDAVVAEVATDATGTASASLPYGGSVTVAPASVKAAGDLPNMYTYLGVKNGDELTIGTPRRVPATSFDVTVSVPAGAAPTAQNFLFHSTCDLNAGNTTNARSVTLKLRADCTTADFYAEALDGSYRPIATVYAPGKPVAAGAAIDVGSGFTPVVTSTLTLKHVPAGTEVTPALDLVIGGFYPVLGSHFPVTVTNGTATQTLRHASIAGASVETRVRLDRSSQQLIVTRAPAPITATIDLANADLLTVTARGTYAAATSTVTWTEVGSPADVATATLRIRTGTVRDFEWIVVGPHAGATLHVPTLPASFAEFSLAPSDDVTAAYVAIAAVPGGYDRVRPFVLRGANLGSTSDFFDPFYGGDRLNQLGYVVADGDVAVIATSP